MTRNIYQDLLHIYWPIGAGVGVLVWLATLFALWRWRAARVGDTWPTGKSGNKPLELSWVVLLAAVVAMLLYFTYSSMDDYAGAQAAPAREEVNVTGAKWNWRFDYPKYGITSQGVGAGRVLPTLTVPVDTPIRFHGTSVDVIHAFYIPYERFLRQLFPDRTVTWTMSFGHGALGMHRDWGECDQFCGTYHDRMHFNVHVLSQDDFRHWVNDHRTKGTTAP